ncbi:MAG TPA: bifunctional riboflavin kinase/FAD synthetase [Bryobacteraceae bacterium]|nr:bifunctional riboflavin kinase/FAD synthetase [Bryobacteraceae bacterium]
MIYRSLAETPATFGPCAITIGNFDGVHCGHRQILRRVIAAAREEGWKSAVLTFDPHPARLVAPASAPRLLTTMEVRAGWILHEGIDEILILPFTPEIAALGPEDFVREILVDKLKARAVLVGANFHFGKRAMGDAGALEELGDRYSFETEIIEPVVWRKRVISSSEIRRSIEAGDVSSACRMLGRPYVLSGAVVPGEGRGSKQTVPTLNLDTQAEVLPKDGVYVTRTLDLSGPRPREWPSITNIGLRPTFDGHARTIETYLLSALEGAPPRRIAVEFLRRVRDERKFENAEALKAQILHDVNRAQAYFRRLDLTTSAR